MSWPEIAAEPRYVGIPVTSLYMFAKGERPLAKEHMDRLGISERPPRHQFGWLLSFWETKDWAKEIHSTDGGLKGGG